MHRAVIQGEQETGVTIMRMVEALDAGPMLVKVRRSIGPDETSEAVERDLARLGAAVLVPIVDALATGHVDETPQDDSLATYAPRLIKEEGIVDWSLSAAAVHNRIRGLHPWPHAFTFCRDRRLILLRSTVRSGPSARPGTILEANGDDFLVAAGEGVVAITELQLEGRRPMIARDFLAGHHLTQGEVLAPRP